MQGLVVVDIDEPLQPRIARRSRSPPASSRPHAAIAVQFRYAFVADRRRPARRSTSPIPPSRASRPALPIADARSVYVARTYAYVAAGEQGVVIVDVERPEKPRIDQIFIDGPEGRERREGGLDERQRVRLRRRRRGRAQDPAAHLAGVDAGVRGLQSASRAAAHRAAQAPPARRWPSRRDSTATAPSTRAATRSRSSTASARGR